MNWRGCGRKLLWHNFRNYPGRILDRTEENDVDLSSGRAVSEPEFEPETFRKQSKNGSQWITTFSASGSYSILDTMAMSWLLRSERTIAFS